MNSSASFKLAKRRAHFEGGFGASLEFLNFGELGHAFGQCYDVTGLQMQAPNDADPNLRHSPRQYDTLLNKAAIQNM